MIVQNAPSAFKANRVTMLFYIEIGQKVLSLLSNE